jgi:hypothetical protein
LEVEKNKFRRDSHSSTWRRQDEIQQFVVKSFDYNMMGPKLIERDRQWIAEIKRNPSNSKLITDYLSVITRGGHTLASAIALFPQIMNFTDTGLVVSDIRTFKETIISLLFKHFWNFDNEVLEQHLGEAITRQLFISGVYDKIWNVYKKKFGVLDTKFISICFLNETTTLDQFGTKPRFRLETLKSPYSSVSLTLKRLEEPSSIDYKINLIAEAISDISVNVKTYYKDSKEFSDDKLSLGAEDMIPIFVYCLINAKITSMHTIFNLLGEFMDDDMTLGSAGYCMATIDTAINEIMNMNIDQESFPRIPTNPKPIIKNSDKNEVLDIENSPPVREAPRRPQGESPNPTPPKTQSFKIPHLTAKDEDLFNDLNLPPIDDSELESWFSK